MIELVSTKRCACENETISRWLAYLTCIRFLLFFFCLFLSFFVGAERILIFVRLKKLLANCISTYCEILTASIELAVFRGEQRHSIFFFGFQILSWPPFFTLISISISFSKASVNIFEQKKIIESLSQVLVCCQKNHAAHFEYFDLKTLIRFSYYSLGKSIRQSKYKFLELSSPYFVGLDISMRPSFRSLVIGNNKKR